MIGAWTELVTSPVPYLHDLVATDTGFVGVGLSSDSRNPTPAIWRSSDGRNWTEEPYDLGTEADPDVIESLSTLVSSPDGLTAIGSPVLGIAESDDGRSWTYAALEEGACPVDLAAADETVVAVGGIGPCQMGGFGVPGAWTATAGGGWIGAALDTGGGFFQGVVETASGFVAWGGVADDEASWKCEVGCFVDPARESFAGAPWYSPDGTTWRRVSDPGPFAGATIQGMATTDQGTFAIGWILGSDAQVSQLAAWISENGASWARLDPSVPFADFEEGMGIGIGGGAGGVAVWTQGVPGVTTRIWTSADGRSWDAGAELPLATLAVGPLEDGLIAYGTFERGAAGVSVPCDKDDVVEGRCRTVPGVWVLERMP